LRLTVKLGGSILESETSRQMLLNQAAEAVHGKTEVIIVHGGGSSLTRRLLQLGMESKFVGGLRVTDGDTLTVALGVLAGEVNKDLVRLLGSAGVRAVGLCGADAGCVRCMPLDVPESSPGNLGFVGIPDRVDRGFFDLLLSAGLTPVVASLALGQDQQLYNVNADQMASAIAAATGSDTLVYLTDVNGVLDAAGKTIAHLRSCDIIDLRQRGLLTGGMLPKTSACLDALAKGVKTVRILPGRVPGILTCFIGGHSTEGTSIHD